MNFEHTLIFLTSNLGAREMQKELNPDFGFEALAPHPEGGAARKLDGIGMGAVRRKFSPEFVNRIDSIVTYQPLSSAALAEIVDQQIAVLERHIEKGCASARLRWTSARRSADSCSRKAPAASMARVN